MKKHVYAFVASLACISLNASAHFDNTCKNDMATHSYADINGNRITFSPNPQQQIAYINQKGSYRFTAQCSDYQDPNTPPTIIMTVNGFGIINGTFIPLTTTSPLLHVTGALNADLQQVSVFKFNRNCKALHTC